MNSDEDGLQVSPINPTLPVMTIQTPDLSSRRSVQFGVASAAEFCQDQPPKSSLTPIPPAQAALEFPTEVKEPDSDTQEMIETTKANSALLASWDGFDAEEGNETQAPVVRRRRSRRESGRFLPMDASLLSSNTSDCDKPTSPVGPPCILNATPVDLFNNLSLSTLASARLQSSSERMGDDAIERKLLPFVGRLCGNAISTCLEDVHGACEAPAITPDRRKAMETHLRSDASLDRMVFSIAKFQLNNQILNLENDFLRSLDLIDSSLLRCERELASRVHVVSRTSLRQSLHEEARIVLELEHELLNAQICYERARRAVLKNRFLAAPSLQLTHDALNTVLPFHLSGRHQDGILLNLHSSTNQSLCVAFNCGASCFSVVDSYQNDAGDQTNSLSDVGKIYLPHLVMALNKSMHAMATAPQLVFLLSTAVDKMDRFVEKLRLVHERNFVSVSAVKKGFVIDVRLPRSVHAKITYDLRSFYYLHPTCGKLNLQCEEETTQSSMPEGLVKFLSR